MSYQSIVGVVVGGGVSGVGGDGARGGVGGVGGGVEHRGGVVVVSVILMLLCM